MAVDVAAAVEAAATDATAAVDINSTVALRGGGVVRSWITPPHYLTTSQPTPSAAKPSTGTRAFRCASNSSRLSKACLPAPASFFQPRVRHARPLAALFAAEIPGVGRGFDVVRRHSVAQWHG